MGKKLLGEHIIAGVKIIYDGSTTNGRSCPLVTCPACGRQRRVSYSYVAQLKSGRTTGRCQSCGGILISQAKKGHYKYTGKSVLADGSTIFWDDRDLDDHHRVKVTCGICKQDRYTQISQRLVQETAGICLRCKNILNSRSGPDHHGWKGGRYLDKDGYIMLLVKYLDDSGQELAESMARKNGYVLEHRLVMARKLGRPLKRTELIHHLNGIVDDNRPENVALMGSAAEHRYADVAVVAQLHAEVARLQGILDSHEISY